jgi:long-chain fatty acid transport protein
MKFSFSSTASVALVVAGLLLVPAISYSGGYSVARFGGGHGNPVSVSPASIYYNPGAMALNRDTQIYADYTLAWRRATYDREIGEPGDWSVPDPNAIDQEVHEQTNAGEGTLSNLIGSPMIGITTDFGGSNIVLGAGFYVAFGGQAVWDEQDLSEPAASEAPFAADGPQRWFTIDGTIRILTASLALGTRTDDGRFGVGIAANLNITEVDTIRARNGNGSDEVIGTSAGDIREGRSQVVADGIDPSIGVGFSWEAIKDKFVIAASWQSAPNISGNQELEGTLTNYLAGGNAGGRADTPIYFVQQVPQTFRWGFAYRFLKDDTVENPEPKAELRLTGDFVTWNDFDHQCLVNRSETSGVGDDPLAARELCDFNEDGSPAGGLDSRITQNIVRRWNLGWGIKLGGSYYFNDDIELNSSLSYDANVVPDETLDPVLMDMPKITLDVGAVFGVTDWLDISVLVANVFYFERENTDSGLYDFENPSVQPDANGTYNQNVLLGQLGVNFKF